MSTFEVVTFCHRLEFITISGKKGGVRKNRTAEIKRRWKKLT